MSSAAASLLPEDVVARSGSNFRAGFVCMSAERRAAMMAIYAFCRVADDAVDDAGSRAEGADNLAFWRNELECVERGEPATAIGRGLHEAFETFGGRAEPLHELLEGMAMDLDPVDFPDLPALEVYCHRVASAVGLACLPVFGVRGEEAEAFAESLGQALQMTNIRRDLRSDADAGRVYVPCDWLRDCEVEKEWLGGNGPEEVYRADGPVAQLCERFHEVATKRFGEAARSLRRMSWRERRRLVPARIMGAVYHDLLRRLRRRGGDLGAQSERVPGCAKLWLASSVMLGVRA